MTFDFKHRDGSVSCWSIDDLDVHLIKDKHIQVATARTSNRQKYVYIIDYCGPGRKWKKVLLHRLILNPPASMVVNHIDGNGLNNCRSNLVCCSASDNARGTKKKRNLKGMSGRHRKNGRYWVTLCVDYERKTFGSYDSPEKAAIAYDLAVLEYKPKNFRVLNYPDRDYSGMSIHEWRQQHAIRGKGGATHRKVLAKPAPSMLF